MIAGDPFQRNFTWPVPDPPKSEWTGAQGSQAALKQKALGFNCLNYKQKAEPSLGRHFLPNKTYLDEHCTDGVRFEMMFPSCWNGKDVDSDDHASHVAYPSLVMDGTCPEGFEKRVVSLFFETIWNTYAFKDYDGYFVLANSDPTGYGYHGDFMHGWDQGTLEAAVKKCTNPSGRIEDCDLFDIQSDSDQEQCKFEMPDALKDEDVEICPSGLPNGLAVEWGPEYAFPISYSTSSSATPAVSASLGLSLDIGGFLGNVFAPGSTSTSSAQPTSSASSANSPSSPTSSATPSSAPAMAALAASTSSSPSMTSSTSSSTPSSSSSSSSSSTPSTTLTPTPTQTTPTPSTSPTTSYIQGAIVEDTVYMEQEMVVLVDDGKPYGTETGSLEAVSTAVSTTTDTVSTAVSQVTEAPARKRGHSHGHRHRRNNF